MLNKNIIILRATLEARSPLIIASGEEDALSDTDPMRDANGLPMLPATTLAGALRAAVPDKANNWFGWQESDKGERSAITLSDGLFHWSDNKPRDGLLLDRNQLESDPLCIKVLPGRHSISRQHVKLNEYSVTDGTGKFSRNVVPTGARFTFEVRTRNSEAAETLTAVIKAGLFLGGASRSGYGELVCVAFGCENINLSKDWDRWCKIAGADIGMGSPIEMQEYLPSKATGLVWTVEGQIEGPLLVGGDARNDDEDRAPWREQQITWNNGKGMFPCDDVRVIPGSAIKGVVRHRVLYHLRKAGVEDAEACASSLFGTPAKEGGGHAGHLRFHDCIVPTETKEISQTHVGLDRFSGGARRGVLFSDTMLWRPKLTIYISELKDLSSDQRVALHAALNDMACGLCAIGAEWGEGAGIFENARITPHETAVKGQNDAA